MTDFTDKTENTYTDKSINSATAYKLQKEQSKKLKFSYNEQREYETIEEDIATLEEDYFISRLSFLV